MLNELHHFLKVYTAYKNNTIINFVKEAIYSKVEQEKELNTDLVKALGDAKKGLNIITNTLLIKKCIESLIILDYTNFYKAL